MSNIVIEKKNLRITSKAIKAAENCLIDNGIETDEVEIVLQALGYILIDEELYPE